MRIINNNNIDIKELEILFAKCFDKLKDNDGDNFNDENNQEFRDWFGIDYLKDYLKYSHVILAYENEMLIGGTIIGMQNPLSFPDGKKYEIFILGTLPEYRNKGVGKLLIEEAERVAKDNNVKSIILNTHELMTNTQRFYTNLGYTNIGVLRNYYGNGNAVFFLKDLSSLIS